MGSTILIWVVSANAKAEKAEQKELSQKKKDLRAEIKGLEAELTALGLKKKEIQTIKENAEVSG